MKISKTSVIILVLLVCLLAAVSVGRIRSLSASAEKAEEAAKPSEQKIEKTEAVQTEEPVIEASVQTPQPAEETPEPQAETDSEPETVDCTVEANGYKISVQGATIEQDWNGNDIVVVMMLFTNNNTSEAQYWNFADESAYQNGNMLREDIPVADSKFYNATHAISGGQTIPIYIPFELQDPNAKVDFKISIKNFASGTTLASNSCSMTLK